MLWLQVSGVWAGRRQLRSISDARRVALQCGWLLGSASKSSHVVPSTAWALTAYASPPAPPPTVLLNSTASANVHHVWCCM